MSLEKSSQAFLNESISDSDPYFELEIDNTSLSSNAYSIFSKFSSLMSQESPEKEKIERKNQQENPLYSFKDVSNPNKYASKQLKKKITKSSPTCLSFYVPVKVFQLYKQREISIKDRMREINGRYKSLIRKLKDGWTKTDSEYLYSSRKSDCFVNLSFLYDRDIKHR